MTRNEPDFVNMTREQLLLVQAELAAKGYRYMNPGLETMPWNTREVGVIDPFGNRLDFCEPIAA